MIRIFFDIDQQQSLCYTKSYPYGDCRLFISPESSGQTIYYKTWCMTITCALPNELGIYWVIYSYLSLIALWRLLVRLSVKKKYDVYSSSIDLQIQRFKLKSVLFAVGNHKTVNCACCGVRDVYLSALDALYSYISLFSSWQFPMPLPTPCNICLVSNISDNNIFGCTTRV